jgi:hypothetical protein
MADDIARHNHGSVSSSAPRGTIKETFGRDDSLYAGSRSAERGKELGGGINNLSHSLSGASANQKTE